MIAATLLAFAAVCLFVCSKLRSRGGAALFSVAVFLVLTFGVPFAELAYKCQQPHSEGCVWGRSLLPVSLAVGAVVGLVIAGGAYLMALGFQRRRRNASGATDSSHALEARAD